MQIRKSNKSLACILAVATPFLVKDSLLSETNENSSALTNLYVAQPAIIEKITPKGETNRVMVIEAYNTKPGKDYSLLSVERMPVLQYDLGNSEQVWRTNATAKASTNKTTFVVPYETNKGGIFYTVKEN